MSIQLLRGHCAGNSKRVGAVGSVPCVMPQLGHRLAVFVYVEEAIKAGWIAQVNGRDLASMPHWFVIWPSCHVPFRISLHIRLLTSEYSRQSFCRKGGCDKARKRKSDDNP